MKYEIIYECECDCGKSFNTIGKKDNDNDFNVICINSHTVKKKKKTKRRIHETTNKIIPDDEVINLL